MLVTPLRFARAQAPTSCAGKITMVRHGERSNEMKFHTVGTFIERVDGRDKVTGTAVLRAARGRQKQIRGGAAKRLGRDEELVSFSRGALRGSSNKTLSLTHSARWANEHGQHIEVTETYDPAPAEQQTVSFSAHVAEVAIDAETGAIKVMRIYTARRRLPMPSTTPSACALLHCRSPRKKFTRRYGAARPKAPWAEKKPSRAAVP